MKETAHNPRYKVRQGPDENNAEAHHVVSLPVIIVSLFWRHAAFVAHSLLYLRLEYVVGPHLSNIPTQNPSSHNTDRKGGKRLL